MGAGESGYEVARRQREKAARLARSAELWEKGAAGEVEVARVLGDLPLGWFAVHDLPWPGRTRANIDHVVIGPGGVYVVDAKNWSGTIAVKDDVLRQNGHRREEAVVSAAEAAIAIQQVVPTASTCTGVLCFARDEPIVGWARDVMVCSTSNLRDMLNTRPVVLTADEVARCADAVRAMVRARAVRPTEARRTGTAEEQRRSRGARSVARLGVGLGLTVALLLSIQTGALTTAGGWFSEQLVGVVSDQPDHTTQKPSPPPLEKRKKDRQNEERQQQGQK